MVDKDTQSLSKGQSDYYVSLLTVRASGKADSLPIAYGKIGRRRRRSLVAVFLNIVFVMARVPVL